MPVLPTGVVPVTTVPTVVRFAHEPMARVDIGADGWRTVPIAALADYVTEDRNPENRLGVRAVEVGVPSPLLAHGLCLVDTPGIGSVFAGNTAATRAFIPRIDVALVIVGVDPPLAGDELSLIEEVARAVPDLFIVLNKADRFTETERAEAAAFTMRVLTERLGRDVGPVLQVSAIEHLAGAPDARDWPELVGRLERLAARSRGDLVASAATRGVDRLLRSVRTELELQRSALLRPLAETERQLEVLRATLNDAAQQALELTHLFAAEEGRLSHQFEVRRGAFLSANIADATNELRDVIEAYSGRRGARMRRSVRDAARRIGHARLDPWLANERDEAERAYITIAERFIGHANAFLQRIAAADAEEFARLPREFVFDARLRAESRYYFHQLDPLLYGTGSQAALDWLRTRTVTRRSVEQQIVPYLKALLEMNSTRVVNDLHERVTESRRRLEAEIQRALQDVYVASERGVATARRLHTAGHHAVQDELARLDRLRDELAVLASPTSQSRDSPRVV
jgi:polyhydroxyalkanoate synthesis regulator phasin